MIADIIILVINLFITLFTGILSWIVSILPDSPFSGFDFSFPQELVGYINWMFPFTEVVSILAIWGSCVAAWFFIRIVMKFLRLQ